MSARMLRLTCLAALLSTLGACWLDAKTGCRTKDDCVSDHECVAGTCQHPARDAGQDLSYEEQPSEDAQDGRSELLSPDLDVSVAIADTSPGGSFVAPTDTALEGIAAPLDAPDAILEPDIGSVERPTRETDDPDSDLSRAPEAPIDWPLPPVDASDAPMVVDVDTAVDQDRIGWDSATYDGNIASGNAWELTTGSAIMGLGATQRGADQVIDVFWRGSDDRLKHRWLANDDAWSLEEDLGGTLASSPAAASRSTNVQDVFWRGTDNHLKHRWYPHNGAWSAEEDLGGVVTSSPAALSWGTVALHVFWRGPDGNLKHMSMDYATNQWTVEIDLGISIPSSPAALYRNNQVADVFWRGSDGTVQHVWSTDGTSWSDVQDLGGAIAPGSSPAATSRREGWIDLFWRGTDDRLKHIWMNPSSHWSILPEDLGGEIAGSPAAAPQGLHRLDIFTAHAATGKLAHLAWAEERPASSPFTLNDTDPRITYSSDWQYSPDRWLLDFGEDVHYSTVDGSYFEYTFTGTGIDYVTEREAHEGNVDVSVDGVLQGTINCYNVERQSQQVVYSKTGLPLGSHTIRVTKRDGQFILLDALRVYP